MTTMNEGLRLHRTFGDAQAFAQKIIDAGGTAEIVTDYTRHGLPHAVAYTLAEDTGERP